MSDKTVFANVMCKPSRDYLGASAVSASIAGLSMAVVSAVQTPRAHFVTRAADAALKPAAPHADRWASRHPRSRTPES